MVSNSQRDETIIINIGLDLTVPFSHLLLITVPCVSYLALPRITYSDTVFVLL